MLTKKNKVFCEEYVKNGYNPKKAYKAAYPDSTDTTLNVCPYRLMKNPEVIAYLDELEADIFAANRITAEKIANELAMMAFGNFDDNINANAKLKALDLLQKQWNLQGQRLDVVGKNDIVINITGEDDENNEEQVSETN